MFSTIQEAWGNNFQETRELFTQPSVLQSPKQNQHQEQHIEHFCTSCKARYDPNAKTIVDIKDIDNHIINAFLVGAVVLIFLHLTDK